MTKLKPIAFTPGEPAGIGPDLCVSLAMQPRDHPVVAICSESLIQQRADLLGHSVQIAHYDPNVSVECDSGKLTILPTELAEPSEPGSLNPANADYVLSTLRQAIDGCMEERFSALVTGPLHKGVINDAGHSFSGHTEFLAERTDSYPVMMLACPELKVALATTHLPLKAVSDAITCDNLEQVISILHNDLIKDFAIRNPHILICGLNPHAGESGHLGREEIEVIAPVIEKLKKKGWQLEGPLPADTLFTPPYLRRADAVLAMFHDQGLPVLKHLGFGRAVNITLGLPMIRTSVDHGTALDLAGTGTADTGSLQAALDCAIQMALASQKKTGTHPG